MKLPISPDYRKALLITDMLLWIRLHYNRTQQLQWNSFQLCNRLSVILLAGKSDNRAKPPGPWLLRSYLIDTSCPTAVPLSWVWGQWRFAGCCPVCHVAPRALLEVSILRSEPAWACHYRPRISVGSG